MNKKILNLAIPNILSNLSIPLLSSVDTAVIGHLDSEVYLGAIALGSMIFNFIYWAFGFLRMGATGLTSQNYGAKNFEEVQNILFRSILIAVSAGLTLVILQIPIEKAGFYLIDGSKNVEQYAIDYFYIRIFAAPAALSLFSIQGWLLGLQNAKYPLYISLLVNFSNIFLNLLFIYQFDMNSNGVALGTLISQYVGVGFSFFLIKKKYSYLFSSFNKVKILDKEKLNRFFSVNSDSRV